MAAKSLPAGSPQLGELPELKRLIQAIPGNCVVLDSRGYVICTNRDWGRFGRENGGEVQAPANYLAVCDAAVGEDAEMAHACAAGIRQVLAGELPQFSLDYLCHSPFRQRWFTCYVTPLEWEGQKHALIAHFDISEHKRVQEELRKSDLEMRRAKEQAEKASRAKSAFLVNMSHELRTPLNAVLGFAQLMQSNAGLSSEQKSHLEIITRSGQHLLALINDILDMSKLESGRIELAPAVFDLGALLEDLEAMFRLNSRAKGLQFQVLKVGDLPEAVVADKNKLLQVLVNLLGNAVKFTARGSVTLRVSAEKERLRFELEDTGIGIPQEALGRLFQSFEQVDNEEQAGLNSGSGLGLALSRQIVRLMGGEISVSSEVGKGSVFRFSVSVAQPTTQMPTAEPLPLSLPWPNAGGGVPRVLVVEDTELPPELVGALQRAAQSADYDFLLELAGQVTPHSQPLSRQLCELTEHYAYDQILEILSRIGSLQSEQGAGASIPGPDTYSI